MKDRRRIIVGDRDLECLEELGGEVGRLRGDGSLQRIGRLLEQDSLLGSGTEGSKLD